MPKSRKLQTRIHVTNCVRAIFFYAYFLGSNPVYTYIYWGLSMWRRRMVPFFFSFCEKMWLREFVYIFLSVLQYIFYLPTINKTQYTWNNWFFSLKTGEILFDFESTSLPREIWGPLLYWDIQICYVIWRCDIYYFSRVSPLN